MNRSLKLLVVALAFGSTGTHSRPTQTHDYTTLSANKLLDFRYSFPTIVGRFPALLAKIRADRKAQYDEYLKAAREDASDRKDEHDFPFNRYEFWRDWTVAGNVSPLLSLQSHIDDFTGGAHGNHRSLALLWDERRDTQVNVDRLFGGSAVLWKQIQPTFCRKLEEERRHRNTDSVGCPDRKELTILPVDSDFDYAFDSLRIIADPYVAGSYADGTFVISVPITPTLLKMIDSEYRETFEVQRQ